ncbi:MAG: alpha/beta fold hydrolase [Candidatus Hodarchaeota archaeon]
MKYESLELNPETRKSLPGQFIKLSKGYVHYEIKGHKEGEVVVLVHGFSSPLLVWDNNFEILAEERFRVLRYDLYGRGYTDRPMVRYDLDLFDQQLYELLEKLELSNINIVGLSMGGGITVVFANRHPDLVKRITLIDPIGLPTEKDTFPSFLKIPVLNRFLVKFIGHKRILNGQRDDFIEYDRIEEYLTEFSKQMMYKGFLRSIRSTLVNVPFTGLKDYYKRLGDKKLPIQLFWGEKDPVIPYSTSREVCALIPSIKFHTIKDCGHMPQYTQPDKVNSLLIDFLRST